MEYETIGGLNIFKCPNIFMDICNQMRPLISKHDTRYRKTSLVKIYVLFAIYKLA
jgi:hypothetical protein